MTHDEAAADLAAIMSTLERAGRSSLAEHGS